jgi:hypothetical protein
VNAEIGELYEPLLERDVAGIRPAIESYRRSHSSDDLFQAIARFAVAAYAPSQHAKHAVLAVLSAHDLRDECGERWDDLLIECATYAAQSRQPWSEPPIMDPPDVAGAPATLREASDRLAAERWLAGHLDNSQEIFEVAAEDPSDLGHKLIMADAAHRLAAIVGEKGRYVTLRMAVWEIVAYSGPPVTPLRPNAELLDRLIARCVEEKGSIESAHAVFHFAASTSGMPVDLRPGRPPAIYRLARDYGQCLKAHAVAKRLRGAFPRAKLDEFVAACEHNLAQGPSFEEWSFA